MVSWTAESNGGLRLVWGSPDDFLAYVQNTVAPAAAQYGLRLIIERIPDSEPRIDRV